MKDNKKETLVKAFREATQEHTHNCSTWDSQPNHSVETPFPYPIPSNKYTIDENYGKNEICIRCKRCWTDDLIAVAKKVAPKFRATVSGQTCMSGFGTAYNFFTIRLS
jgi:hypothetical protein